MHNNKSVFLIILVAFFACFTFSTYLVVEALTRNDIVEVEEVSETNTTTQNVIVTNSEYKSVSETTVPTEVVTSVRYTTKIVKETSTILAKETEVKKEIQQTSALIKKEIEQNIPSITLEEVISKYQGTISYDMDVTMLSGFTLEEFQILMDGISIDDETDFYSIHAETIYNLSHQYEINEIFFAGIISAESWWGCAENCIYKNNYTGMMSNGSLIAYSSVYENLEETASNLHNNYLTEGGACYNGKTIAGVSVCYCDSSWIDLVWERMQQIF